MEIILGGDVGGTNTRLDMYRVDRNSVLPLRDGMRTPGKLVFSKQYLNENFSSFEAALEQFFRDAGDSSSRVPIAACIACAGPVCNNKVEMTNRDGWIITAENIKKVFGIKTVNLINDFAAVGYGLLTLQKEELVVLQDAPRQSGAPMATIGAGTGLGECYLTPGPGGDYVCYPCEGGHAEFAPRSELEINMLKFFLAKFEAKHRVSVERVVSGPGLANVYEYLAHEMPDKIDPALHEKISSAGDFKGRVIATNKSNELCRLTMDIFAGAYGSEAGVAALKWLPQNGLYITGGLTPKNIDLITNPKGPFLAAFHDKGRVSKILKTVPVYAVLAEDVGQRGAYRQGYKYFLDLISAKPSRKEAKSLVSSTQADQAREKRNRLIVLAGFITTLFVLGAKNNNHC